MGTRLIALVLTGKLIAFAAVTLGAGLAWPPAAWVVGGALAWWFIKEEVEPWAVARLAQKDNEQV